MNFRVALILVGEKNLSFSQIIRGTIKVKVKRVKSLDSTQDAGCALHKTWDFSVCCWRLIDPMYQSAENHEEVLYIAK